ncbi:MAG: methylated-DNA--[protein]-cysteine S-methyltransferase [Acidobacteriota bacterium]|nr:methylated-DNA--[protein]-cysteine S-methyltransferase [Acidobacteriota bacterium]MDE2963447.1 methylated-DNA--[protein]-cysteine S-methyltransferase [Acidobacteriota bacterium]
MSVESDPKISYHIGDSSFGRLLIAASSKGLCGLMWGDGDRELLEALAERFRRFALRPGLEKPQRWFEPVNRFLGGDPVDLAFPLDPGGTAFQRTVWRRIRQIPLGRTQTYAGLAKDLGNPGGVRAVAGACAANPVALVIPCHRVIRSDGGLGGYRWGLARKRRLLSLEASMVEDGPWRLTAPAGPERVGAALPDPLSEHGSRQESGNP